MKPTSNMGSEDPFATKPAKWKKTGEDIFARPKGNSDVTFKTDDKSSQHETGCAGLDNYIICPHCGQEVQKVKFCTQCGRSLRKYCTGCGIWWSWNNVYCGECGKRLGEK